MLGTLTVEGQARTPDKGDAYGESAERDKHAHADAGCLLLALWLRWCCLLCSVQSVGSEEYGVVRQDEPAGETPRDGGGRVGGERVR